VLGDFHAHGQHRVEAQHQLVAADVLVYLLFQVVGQCHGRMVAVLGHASKGDCVLGEGTAHFAKEELTLLLYQRSIEIEGLWAARAPVLVAVKTRYIPIP
jgi:hypothetical protein